MTMQRNEERRKELDLLLSKTPLRAIREVLMQAKKKGSAYLGRVGGWTVRIRAVRCGKPTCRKCPHCFYAYAEKRERGRLKTRYLGVVR